MEKDKEDENPETDGEKNEENLAAGRMEKGKERTGMNSPEEYVLLFAHLNKKYMELENRVKILQSERAELEICKYIAENEIKENEEEMKNEIDEKEERIIYLEKEMKKKEKKNIKEKNDILENLESEVKCPVCLLVPRTGRFPVCKNGHVTCENCKR